MPSPSPAAESLLGPSFADLPQLAPLVRDGKPLGAIVLRRRDARLFSDRQVELVQTFADQAAIAISNVRLFNETQEALERQTAMGEILRVISTSPTDVQPVLDAIAESARRFCAAEDAVVADPSTAGLPFVPRSMRAFSACVFPVPGGPRIARARSNGASTAIACSSSRSMAITVRSARVPVPACASTPAHSSRTCRLPDRSLRRRRK